MASLFVHAALPTVARRAIAVPSRFERRLWIVAVVVSCIVDLDLAAYIAEVRPPALLAHGGIFHSLAFALILGLAAAVIFFRALGTRTREWKIVAAFLCGCAMSHPLLDWVTASDTPVALLAPFSSARVSAPIKLIPSCPLGLDEYFTLWGILTFANELLYVVIPASVVVALLNSGKKDAPSRGRVLRAAGVWLVCAIVARIGMPEYFAPVATRVMRPIGSEEQGDIAKIPRDGLPDGKLVTSLTDLRAAGLLDRDLVPDHVIWSSSFFPTWLGDDGGRWSDGNAKLVWRTFFGTAPPSAPDARNWLQNASNGDAAARDRLFHLSPTEKLDLVFGNFDFPETRRELALTKGALPRFWSGRCNGVGAAALALPEPSRDVDVIGVDGHHVVFHPNDVKALLAAAFNETAGSVLVGKVCTTLSFDAGATCSINPAALVIGLTNRIGLAHESFLVDALPTAAKQYYGVASARVSVLGEPHAPGKIEIDPSLAPHLRSVVDVDIVLTLSSTVLSYAPANRIDRNFPDGTHYEKVGVVPVIAPYHATLALDDQSNLIGGVWRGDPADGPDDMFFTGTEPLIEDGKLREPDELLPWPLVRELARVSAQDGDGAPVVDLRTHCDGRC
ncbi:MAG: metal-dependent hydrolase [Polyangiaceae bacterium]